MTIVLTASIAVAWIAFTGSGIALIFRKQLLALWREPVLRAPVLIVESDDWGPGPDSHALQLGRLAQTLARHRDRHGRHAMMTLGIVLAVPDTQRIAQDGLRRYHRLPLADPRFGAIVAAMKQGESAGVFALQLHGMEHFWPPALMAAAASDSAVGAWLTATDLPNTEDLPAHLQSRWTDAASLPSHALAQSDIALAVEEEVAAFAATFGNPPEVAVPPTFIWNEAVESAWAARGVRFLVTPGRRYEARDGAGKPASAAGPIHNGQTSSAGMTCIVRDDYFEPLLGHTATRGLDALAAKTRLGRPTLLETHRSNFTGDAAAADTALQELDRLLQTALERFPHLAFMSTAQLAEGMRRGQGDLVESAVAARVHVWLRRAAEISRLRKLAWATGLAPLAWLALLATRPGSGLAPARAAS